MGEEKKQEKDQNRKQKFEQTVTGEKKKNTNAIIISGIIIVIVLVAILVGIFATKSSPKDTIETMFHELKEGNYNQEILANTLNQENFSEEAQKLIFDKLEWKIQNVKEEGDTATVEVEITNKDFKTIISNYMQKALKAALSGQNVNEDEMTNYLIEELKKDEIPTITENKTIKLEKKEGKWEPTEENDFVDILLPGFKEAISAFQ